MDAEFHKLLLKKAGALLARRAYSRGELCEKLVRIAGGIPVEDVLDRLEQLNLLNDADYAYNFALYRVRQEGWPPARVQQCLVRRQVEQSVIDSALERVRHELGADAPLARCLHKYCRNRGTPEDPKSVRKLVLYLRRRGFDEDSIISGLKQIIPEAKWQHFETGE
jgi:regulatory protein